MARNEIYRHGICGSVFQKIAHPIGRSCGRSAHTKARADGFEGAGGMTVKLEVGGLFGFAGPEIDVRLIPHLEIPLRDLVEAIAFDKVTSESADKVVPFAVILGRRDDLLVPERMNVLASGELSGHEADFDERTDAVGEKTVVDLVHVGKVVERTAGVVFVVDAVFVVKNGVEADVTEVGYFLHSSEIVAIAFAHGERSPA